MNFGNHIIKILLPKLADRMAGSVLVLGDAQRETNCGNAIAKIGGNFFFLAIVAMPLPKMGGKKKLWLSKSGEELKKKSATSTIFLQHFYNKS